MRSRVSRLLAAAALLAPLELMAAGGVGLLSADVDLGDRSAMQRGARTFMNYCSGCHGLSFMRYKRMGEDLGIPGDLVKANLQFTGEKVEDRMLAAMPEEAANRWFGVAPPDLSVVARSRGPDWIYSYLVTFYEDADPSRMFGVNNVVFPAAAMPHVLWPLQGRQVLTRAERPENVVAEHPGTLEIAGSEIRLHQALEVKDGDEVEHVEVVDRLEVVAPGELGPAEYRRTVRDLVTFLTYVGEPAKLSRYSMGLWVLAFLAVFFVLTRALYKEYWRDVH